MIDSTGTIPHGLYHGALYGTSAYSPRQASSKSGNAQRPACFFLFFLIWLLEGLTLLLGDGGGGGLFGGEGEGEPPAVVGPREPPTMTLPGGVLRAGEETGAGEVSARGGLF